MPTKEDVLALALQKLQKKNSYNLPANQKEAFMPEYSIGSYYAPEISEGQRNIEKYSYPIPNKQVELMRDGSVHGLSSIVKDIERGAPYLYFDNLDPNQGGKYYTNAQGEYLMLKPYAENVNMDGYTEIPFSSLRRLAPKRDFIGGGTEEARLNAIRRIPGFINKIGERAKAYGLDPNLLLHRIMKEGFLDNRIRDYNIGLDSVDQNGYWENIWDKPVDGFMEFGLDDAGDNLINGKYELKDENASWDDNYSVNEKGRQVHSVWTPNLSSAIEIKAAEMAYRQAELAKRGKTGSQYVNAAYNLGLNHKDLDNDDYVNRQYTVPNYGFFSDGGDIHIKESKKGTFTAAAKAHGKSVQAFASQVLANKDNYSPAMVKKANFARNASKWHSDGGPISEALNSGKIDLLRAAINEVKKKKLS